jgi:hypothetical protein
MEDTIMKKTYINPEIAVIKIASKAQMLAGSEIPTGSTPTSPESSDARSFDFDDFDDLDEEDF